MGLTAILNIGMTTAAEVPRNQVCLPWPQVNPDGLGPFDYRDPSQEEMRPSCFFGTPFTSAQ